MTPQNDEQRYPLERYANDGPSGAERWVKWFAGLALPLILAMGIAMVSDHTEIAVLKSTQSDMIQRQLEKTDRMLGLMEKVIEQHRDMIARQDRISDRLDADALSPDRRTPVFSNGRRFENK